MSTASPKLSFTITSIHRHLTSDSAPGSPLARSANASPKRPYTDLSSSDNDDDEKINDELVTGFDRFGVQRSVFSSRPPGSGSQLTLAPFCYIFRKYAKKKPEGPLVIPA